MAETLRQREKELINSIRTNTYDPEGRGTEETENFVATAGQTVFTLSETTVKYIKSVHVNGVEQNIGYDYTLQLGEGTEDSTVTLKDPLVLSDTVDIVYHWGQTILYEGFQRLNSSLPRMSMILNGATSEMISIGEDGEMGGGKQKYWTANYQVEVRSSYAAQLKDLLNDFSNMIDSLRQNTPQLYKTLIITVDRYVNYDFDNQLRLYRGRIFFTVKWIVQFK